jgi:methylenetetrahydrofolate reductase (NADPH)
LGSPFQEALQSGNIRTIARIVPPKSADLFSLAELASSWKGKVDTILLADNPSGVMGVSPLVPAQTLKREGHDVVMTLSCRDRNRMALGSAALGAAALSIGSILCVSGDYFNFGDHPDAKPVYDLDSVQLIGMLREMENGKDIGGNALAKPLDLFLGAAVCPTADPLAPQLAKARKKAMAGAEFFITLPIFATEQLSPFISGAKDLPVKILAGVLLPSYQEIAQYRDGSIPGTFIPEELAQRWRDEGEEAFQSSSAGHVRKLISELKASGDVAGVCVSASGRESEIAGLL